MTVKIGDEVIFPPYTGTEVKLDGQEYVIMRESEALLVCK
jgi:chaperonin GroES